MPPQSPPICKYYHPPPPQPRKKSRQRSFSNPTSPTSKSRTTRFTFLSNPFHALTRLYRNRASLPTIAPPHPTATAPTPSRPISRPLRNSLRKHPYLHILLLPALFLLLFEFPIPFLPPPFYLTHSPAFNPQTAPVPHQHPPASSHSLSHPPLPAVAHAVTHRHRLVTRCGVSIVACCMNRHDTLRRVLPEWQKVHNVSEILLVDWSSSPPLAPLVHDIGGNDDRLRVVRVEAEPRWVLSRAYNLGVRTALFDKIIRLDCDYRLSRDFVGVHDLGSGGTFYAGNYKRARNENEVHLNGAVVVRREDFLSVGGYDERIQSYGWDDEDLYGRLVEAGLGKKDVSYKHLRHVPHDDGERAQKDVKFVQVEIDLNALLLKHVEKWNTSAVEEGEWELKGEGGSGRYAVMKAARRPVGLKELVGTGAVEEAWSMALGQRLANDYQIPWDIMETMSVEMKRRLLRRLNERMEHRASTQPARVLFVHLMHGLGNRLRALASAMSFAKETDRELVVIWETDAHIAAKFSELFRDELVVMREFKPKWPFRDYDKWDKAWLSFEFFNYMEMEGDGAVKGQWIVDRADKHFYFKSAYVMEADSGLTNWNRDNAMLRSLQPVEEVVEMIAGHEDEALEDMIGIHIRDRTLDRDIKNVNFTSEYGAAASREMEYWRQKSSYKTFVEEMHELVSKQASLRFYVATDTVEVIGKLEAEFPGRIWYTKRNCDGRDGYCVRFALVDMICLSKTKELIGSNWSSFTEAACRFGGKKARLAGQDFGVDRAL